MQFSIQYRQGNVLDAPTGSVLVHACNTQGVWGAGVAAQLAARFPRARHACGRLCISARSCLLGTAHVLNDGDYAIACLFTSHKYGGGVDPPDAILLATLHALESLLGQFHVPVQFHSPKINAGLFRVPWEQTEHVLQEALASSPVAHRWTVWTP